MLKSGVRVTAPNVTLLSWMCGQRSFWMNQNLRASFLCLLYRTELYLILQRKGTLVVLYSLHAGISPDCCSVNYLRGGRQRQVSPYLFHLSADSFETALEMLHLSAHSRAVLKAWTQNFKHPP